MVSFLLLLSFFLFSPLSWFREICTKSAKIGSFVYWWSHATLHLTIQRCHTYNIIRFTLYVSTLPMIDTYRAGTIFFQLVWYTHLSRRSQRNGCVSLSAHQPFCSSTVKMATVQSSSLCPHWLGLHKYLAKVSHNSSHIRFPIDGALVDRCSQSKLAPPTRVF